MDFNEAKEYLKNGYIQAGLNLIDEHDKELFFRRPPHEKMLIRISEQEIEECAAFEQLRLTFQKLPAESSICSPNYREHMVTSYDPRRFPGPRDRVFVFGEQGDEVLYAEVGPATASFVNFFRLDEAYCQFSLERLGRAYLRGSENKSVDLFEILYKPLTVRVYNLQTRDAETALKRSSSIVDACLFELSYLKNITLKLEEEWPHRRPRVKPFRFEETIKGNQLPLPQVGFNPDIIRFYQRGMGTYDPVDQFLSFYHVLEYYFVAVSDEQLYSKLSRRINDPRFSTTPSYLDRIIQDALNHKRKTDETDMLKLVLEKYVDEAGLIEFIAAYEEYLGEKIYTRKRSVFGESVEVRLVSGHVFGNLATRVRVTRNALVHSSDRYERQQRYIPTVKAENSISREIPLMRYLAERVIIAAAK